MSASVHGGPFTRELARDTEGHRNYSVEHIVKTTDSDDGPTVVLGASGLPVIGSLWNFGNDLDVWAFCYPDMKIRGHEEKKGEPPEYWKVTQKFSTRPLNRCQDETIEDPLLQDQVISGSFVKYTQEISKDRFDDPIKTSSHELIHGPQVEFDFNRPTVRIEQNVATLELALFTAMIDTVNGNTLWGLSSRKIKLSDVSWERKWYGTCNIYYTRVFDFDIDFNTFDRVVLDEGTKVLNGHWPTKNECENAGAWILDKICTEWPDKDNPSHFTRYKDRNGENTRVILDGKGQPADSFVRLGTGEGAGTGTDTDPAAQIFVEYYDESNFLLLGIPTTF